MMKSGAKKYFDGAMHQAGEETVKYEAANGGQQVDDAKAAVQVSWEFEFELLLSGGVGRVRVKE